MVETLHNFTLTDTKLIERILENDHVGINHMVLPKGDALPQHYANAPVYMVVVRGTITLRLDEQAEHDYSQGSIIGIPHKTKMNVFNQGDKVVELFVIKAPSPRHFRA